MAEIDKPITNVSHALRHGGAGNPGRIEKARDARSTTLRLAGYLLAYKLPMLLVFLLVIGYTLCGLAGPYLMGRAIDGYIASKDMQGLIQIALLMVLAYVLTNGFQVASNWIMAKVTQKALKNLRTDLFANLQQLSLSFYDRNKVGKIMSRVQSDVQQIQELLTADILNIVVSILTLVTIASVMTVMNARLALLTLSVVPVFGLVIFIWQQYARRAFFRVRGAIAAVNAQLQEGISGVRVTQSLSREEVNLKQFDAVNRTHLNANLNATKLTAVMMPTGEIMTAMAYGMVMAYGGYQVLAGRMGVGVLLGFLLYVQRFFSPVQELVMEYTELQRAMVAGTRIFELLDIKPEIKDSPQAVEMPPIKGEIKFTHVSFSYRPDVEVLHDINLTVSPGETVAIVGKTGAGKSSLANLIARFYEVDKGEVTVGGYNVCSVTQQSLRRQMGIVSQDPFLFSGSIEDNIRYGHIGASHEDIVNAAKAAGAHDFIIGLERGYDTLVEERGINLSAGQRQFICLARAILADPPVLILDEATSNVDTRAERLMQKSLRHIIQGRTCLIIAHRLSTVTEVDRIVVLEYGKIAEIGSHQELLARRGLYHQMVEASNKPDKNVR